MDIKSQVPKYYNSRTGKRVDIFSTLILQILNALVPCWSTVHHFSPCSVYFFRQMDLKNKVQWNCQLKKSISAIKLILNKCITFLWIIRLNIIFHVFFLILRVMLAAFCNILQNIQLHQISGCGEVFGTSTKQSGRKKSWLSLSIYCCSCVWSPSLLMCLCPWCAEMNV